MKRTHHLDISWWVLVAAAVIAISYVGYQQSQTHLIAKRADLAAKTNARLLNEFKQFRAARLKQTDATDLKLCRAINTITRRDRATIRASGKNTAGLLRLIGVPENIIKEIVASTNASKAKELERRPLVRCLHLPTSASNQPKP